jgi:hypothetical protein
VDLLAVRRGRVGEEDDGVLRGHDGWFVWRCVVGIKEFRTNREGD